MSGFIRLDWISEKPCAENHESNSRGTKSIYTTEIQAGVIDMFA